MYSERMPDVMQSGTQPLATMWYPGLPQYLAEPFIDRFCAALMAIAFYKEVIIRLMFQ